MFLKYVILFCVVVLLVDTQAFVKRDAAVPPDPIDALKKNVDALKNCLDQTLSKTVSDVNVEKHLNPVFAAVGDQISRISKAYEQLTAPGSSPAPLVD